MSLGMKKTTGTQSCRPKRKDSWKHVPECWIEDFGFHVVIPGSLIPPPMGTSVALSIKKKHF